MVALSPYYQAGGLPDAWPNLLVWRRRLRRVRGVLTPAGLARRTIRPGRPGLRVKISAGCAGMMSPVGRRLVAKLGAAEVASPP